SGGGGHFSGRPETGVRPRQNRARLLRGSLCAVLSPPRNSRWKHPPWSFSATTSVFPFPARTPEKKLESALRGPNSCRRWSRKSFVSSSPRSAKTTLLLPMAPTIEPQSCSFVPAWVPPPPYNSSRELFPWLHRGPKRFLETCSIRIADFRRTPLPSK